MFHECRARIRLLKREGLQFAFLMMLQSSVVRQLLSKLLENTHKHILTYWFSLSRTIVWCYCYNVDGQILWHISSFLTGGMQRWKPRCSAGLRYLCSGSCLTQFCNIPIQVVCLFFRQLYMDLVFVQNLVGPCLNL
jgi:hypothetical protein